MKRMIVVQGNRKGFGATNESSWKSVTDWIYMSVTVNRKQKIIGKCNVIYNAKVQGKGLDLF